MLERKNISEELNTLGALLRLPYQKLLHRTYTELAANGFEDIRPAHSNVFRYILPTGSRMTDLAERAHLTKQSMAYLVNYLEAHNYVELAPDPSDGRAKLVCLTPRGTAFLEAVVSVSSRLEKQLAKQLGEAEMRQLRNLLEKLSEHFDELE